MDDKKLKKALFWLCNKISHLESWLEMESGTPYDFELNKETNQKILRKFLEIKK